LITASAAKVLDLQYLILPSPEQLGCAGVRAESHTPFEGEREIATSTGELREALVTVEKAIESPLQAVSDVLRECSVNCVAVKVPRFL
jgi:hypothetical protein